MSRRAARSRAPEPSPATLEASPPASPAATAWRSVRDGAAVGCWSALPLAVIETTLVAILWRRSLESAADLGRLTILVWALLFLAGMLVGALAGAGRVLVGRVAARLARRSATPAAWAARMYTLLAAPVITTLCVLLLSGPQVRRLPAWWLIVAGASLSLQLLLYLALRLRPRLEARRAARGGARVPLAAEAAAWLAAAVTVGVVDQRVLRGLYPAFHVALALACVVAVAGAVRATTALRAARGARGRRPRDPWLRGGGLAAATVAALAIVAILHEAPSVRFLASERTTVAARVLQVLGPVLADEELAPAAATALATTAALPATSGVPRFGGPLAKGSDLILVTIDAARADHMSLYGYGRPTTPWLAAEAGTGTVFERAYAPVPETSHSLLSMFTGTNMHALSRLGRAAGRETLADVLRQKQLATGAFFPWVVFFVDRDRLASYERSAFGFGFVGRAAAERSITEALPAEQRVDEILSFLRAHRGERVFVWAHFIEPHAPWVNHPGHVFGQDPVDRYDSEIAAVDQAVGRLLDVVHRERRDPVVVITADHGEAFGEHGAQGHGSSLYDEQVRVPLILTGPGVPVRRVAAPVGLVDVPATVLRLLGFEPPPGMGGTDLGPWLASTPQQEHLLPPVFAEIGQRRMVVAGNHKLICNVATAACELYDTAKDPAESRNLVATMPKVYGKLREQLRWFGVSHALPPPAVAAGQRPAWQREALERGRLGEREATAGLARLLGEPDADLRTEAARLLAALPDERGAHAALRQVLSDPRAGPWAAAALARACDPAALARLADLDRPVPELAGRAAVPLVKCGRPSRPLLWLGLKATDTELRRDVVLALGELPPDAEVVAALWGLRHDAAVRRQMLEAFLRNGAPELGAYFEGLLQDREAVTSDRQLAVRALVRVQGRAALPLLRRVFSADDDRLLRGSVLHALYDLGDLPQAVRGPAARITAARGELWVGLQKGAHGEIRVVQPTGAGAPRRVHGEADALVFSVRPGPSAVRVVGPVAFLFGN